MSSRCWDCGGLITWVRVSDSRRMAIDLEPSPEGYVVVDDCGRAHVLTKKAAQAVGGPRYVPHLLTCSNPRE